MTLDQKFTALAILVSFLALCVCYIASKLSSAPGNPPNAGEDMCAPPNQYHPSAAVYHSRDDLIDEITSLQQSVDSLNRNKKSSIGRQAVLQSRNDLMKNEIARLNCEIKTLEARL